MAQKKRGIIERLSRFATNHRLRVLVLALVVAGAMGAGITRMKGEVVLEEML